VNGLFFEMEALSGAEASERLGTPLWHHRKKTVKELAFSAPRRKLRHELGGPAMSVFDKNFSCKGYWDRFLVFPTPATKSATRNAQTKLRPTSRNCESVRPAPCSPKESHLSGSYWLPLCSPPTNSMLRVFSFRSAAASLPRPLDDLSAPPIQETTGAPLAGLRRWMALASCLERARLFGPFRGSWVGNSGCSHGCQNGP